MNEGFNVIMHAETRFGEDINAAAGAFAIPNVSMLYPLPGSHETAITGLIAMQALNEKVALAGGKFNISDLWAMIYPHTGRGVEGFMNLNAFSLSIPWLRWTNLSVNGAGVLSMKGKQIQGALVVMDTNNSTTTTGISNLFDQGAALIGLWRIFTNYGGLPGSHMFIGGWSSRSYTSLERNDWTFIPGQGIVAGQQDEPWSLGYFFNQVLWADPCNAQRNLRLFTSISVSDGNPSFGRHGGFISLEGTGLSDSRQHDRTGIAYFYNEPSSGLKQLLPRALDLDQQHGVELYYNAEITPWFHLTADLQVIDSANTANDTAVIVGVRSNIRF